MSDWLVERMTEQIRGLQDELAEANRLRVQAEKLMECAEVTVRRKNLKITSLESRNEKLAGFLGGSFDMMAMPSEEWEALARAAIEAKVSWTDAEE